MTDEQSTENDETAETSATEEPPETSDDENVADETTEDDEPETFTREYVKKLREEAATARVKAKDRDDLAQRLHTVLVAATGRLADPTDLPYSEEHLADEQALTTAIDELIARKPHLADRRPVGDIGQGATTGDEPVSLAGILRANAT